MRFLLQFTLLCALVTAEAASCPAQTPVWGNRVDDEYRLDSQGQYRMIPNRRGEGTQRLFNFAVYGTDGIRRAVPLADPSIMPLDIEGVTWYFVTGTSDGAYTANYAIYKSRDLVTWYPHMLAFQEPAGARMDSAVESDPDRGHYAAMSADPDAMLRGPFFQLGFRQMALQIGERLFTHMWAPHLYKDADKVFMCFTAVELSNPGNCGAYPFASTLFLTSIPLQDFTTPTPGVSQFGVNHQGERIPGEPLLYNYRVDNNGAAAIDGGWQQHLAHPETPNPTIPTSAGVKLPYFDTCHPNDGPFGTLAQTAPGESLRWRGFNVGGRTVPSLDGYIYFDTLDKDRRWMLYTWWEYRTADGGFNGNNVAAYPMINNRNMDALAGQDMLLPLAFRFNTSNPVPRVANDNCPSPQLQCASPNGCLFNGASADSAFRMGGCDLYGVAEGPAAFARNKRTYVLFSRNAYNSPAYGIFYRFADGPFSELRLPGGFSDADAVEYPLVWSKERDRPYGRSYGHGEVFIGPTAEGQEPRYYLVFHAKRDDMTERDDPFRTVFFKELRFEEEGKILSFQNEADPSISNADTFLIPFPCIGDFDHNHSVQEADLFDFLNAWLAGDPAADIDGSGALGTPDIFAFLNAWFAGCAP